MPPGPLPPTARKNVEAIAQVEQQLLGRRSRAERLADGIAGFFGSPSFVLAHALCFAGWTVLNSGVVPGVAPFDPYPFPFLGFVVGVEFIFLTTFVLMNQNLQARRQEQWAHLSLQIGLLAEQEVTKNMQMLHLICQHLGLDKPARDREVNELAQATPVAALVEEIEKAREAGEAPAGDVGKARRAEAEVAEGAGERRDARPEAA